ncbi:MAG TPA: hypothetical protein EYP20_01575, partial [Aigarchaeota archaeon]|nr:hypothetical protein [Aigarchaeota archaeon]
MLPVMGVMEGVESSRRLFLKIFGGAALGWFGWFWIGYFSRGLLGPGETVTETVTVTTTKVLERLETVTKTVTVEKTVTERVVETVTTTRVLYAPRIEGYDFTKDYTMGLLRVDLRFKPEAEVKEAMLELTYPYKASLDMVRTGFNSYSTTMPLTSPADHYFMFDAVSREGVRASDLLSPEERTFRMKHLLSREEYGGYGDYSSMLDVLFKISIEKHKDPEGLFLQAFRHLNGFGRLPRRVEGLETLANYSLATLTRGLPFKKEHSIILDAVEIDPSISDFSPVVIRDANNVEHVFGQ